MNRSSELTRLLALAGLLALAQEHDAFAQSAPSGKIEFAQTHVVPRSGGTRLAPVPIIHRQALLLFTPDTPVPAAVQPYLDVRQGSTTVYSVPLTPPPGLPGILESGLTQAKLQPYSTAAWSAVVPAADVVPQYSLGIRYGNGASLDATPVKWARPARFTIGRLSLVLWPTAQDPTTSEVPISKLARDYYGSIPVSTLNYFDYTTLKLDYAVLQGGNHAPRKYTRFADVTADGANDLYGKLLKPFAIRASLANTGRGLLIRDAKGATVYGDSSPYSFGSYIGIGWYYDAAKGKYQDANTFGYSGGWTGWAATWNYASGQCGNLFAHELGHSLGLSHFTEWTAKQWGIADEYPNDGINGPNNPWGFDTVHNQFRTWYRVNADGPVIDKATGQSVGKHDPMNGGEDGNAVACYPQFTAYQAMKMQNWLDTTPTLADQAATPGVYRWNGTTLRYDATSVADGALAPVKIDTPVATLIGTLTASSTDGTSQVYPPLFAKSGNVFALPSPFGSGLPALYADARYFVKISYADGSVDYALIPDKEITGTTQLDTFSLNLDLQRHPRRVELFHSRKAYPAITEQDSELIHARDIEAPAVDQLPAPVVVGS
nr:M66 family metalloprotease [Burkholderia gladioli]